MSSSISGNPSSRELAHPGARSRWGKPVFHNLRAWPLEYWVIAVACGIYGVLVFYRLGLPSLGSDEGRFGISALNILHSARQVALVSEQPLGGVGTKPFFYPLELSLSILVFGRTAFALRFVNAVGLLAAALCLGRAVQKLTRDRLIAAFTATLFLLNPWTITYARVAMPDTAVVIWGCIGLLAAVRFLETRRYRWASLAGAVLGLGFLSKMWLVFPFVVACASLILASYPVLRRRVLLPALTASLCFLLVASSHLLLALWLAPSSLHQWLHVYFGFSLGSRWNGPGFDPAMWYHPWWFYLFGLFRATFFGLPLLVLGAISLARSKDVRTAVVVASLLLPLPILSIFLVKQTSYLYPISAALALIMALGAADWLRRRDSLNLLISVGISMVAAIVVVAARLLPVDVVVAVLALYAACAALSIAPAAYRRLAVGLALALVATAMLVADGRVVREDFAHRYYYRPVVAYFRKEAASLSARDTAFIAPAYPAFEFYLFRRGEYWKTWYVDTPASSIAQGCRQRSLIFFVVDSGRHIYGGEPTPAQREALNGCAKDVTSDIESRIHNRIPLQVFAARRD